MKQFDVYLFDFDGTIVDSKESLFLVFKIAYGEIGVEITEENVTRLMRVQLGQGYEELHAPKEKFGFFCDEIIRLLDDYEVLLKTKIYHDTLEALSSLYKQGKTLGIVTSNNRKHVGEVLRFLGINEDYFSVIIGNQETKKHKPNPDPILKALEVLNVPGDNVCYVGDGQDDMTCALASGVNPVLLDRIGEYKTESFVKIDSLIDLLN